MLEVRRAIQGSQKNVQFIELDTLWREAFPGEPSASSQRFLDLRNALGTETATRLGLHGPIVIGQRLSVLPDGTGNPFYSTTHQRTEVQVVIVPFDVDHPDVRQIRSSAEGIEREGWIPGTPLIFVRFYKDVNTDEAALRGLAKAVLDAVRVPSAEAPLRLAVVAEEGDGSKNYP